jgi:hypothetical protein
MSDIYKIAEELKEKYLSNKHVDFSSHEEMHTDPSITLEEHEGTPHSYMVFNNLKNIIIDASELLSLMNEHDVLPAWTQEMVSSAKMSVGKALDYVRAEKSE